MTRIPVMEALGEELDRALQRAPERRRGRRGFAAGVVSVLVVVPVAVAAVRWAPQLGGDAVLPTKAEPGARLVAAGGATGPWGRWQLVVYRGPTAAEGDLAALCFFLQGEAGGIGRCVRPAPLAPLTLVSGGAIVSGVTSRDVRRVDVTLEDDTRLALATTPLDREGARQRGLPAGLRTFVISAPPQRRVQLRGLVARSADGRALARSGRPRPLPQRTATLQSPVVLAEGETP